MGGAWALGAFDDPAPVAEVAAPIPTDVASTSTGPTAINVAEIYKRSAPGVVQIVSTSRGAASTDIFGNPVPGETQRALGSGFVIDKEGHVVTNYHVVQGATSIEVSFSNQETVSAKVVGTDPSTDLELVLFFFLSWLSRLAASTPMTSWYRGSVVTGDARLPAGIGRVDRSSPSAPADRRRARQVRRRAAPGEAGRRHRAPQSHAAAQAAARDGGGSRAKNILMMADRRRQDGDRAALARLAQSPFLKVEASKLTEVGYVGRDVESMIRDLTEIAVELVREERMAEVREKAKQAAEERVLDLLLPPLPPSAEFDADAASMREQAQRTREKLREQLREGRLDHKQLEIDVRERSFPSFEIIAGSSVEEVDINVKDMLPGLFRGARASAASRCPRRSTRCARKKSRS